MITAYSYRIKYTDDGYWIFLDEILFATINLLGENTWHVNINIIEQNYLFTESGSLNPSVKIHNVSTGEKLGDISLPLLPFFFWKSVFYRAGKPLISWKSKNLFSFYWMWKQNDAVLMEGVEDFTRDEKNGVIKISDYFDEQYLLIVAGVFLSINRKPGWMSGLLKPKQKNRRNTGKRLISEKLYNVS